MIIRHHRLETEIVNDSESDTIEVCGFIIEPGKVMTFPKLPADTVINFEVIATKKTPLKFYAWRQRLLKLYHKSHENFQTRRRNHQKNNAIQVQYAWAKFVGEAE